MQIRMTQKFIIACLFSIVSLGISAAEFTVEQKEKQFIKDGKLIEKMTVNAGDTIHFKNQDPWFHNVFSLSDIKTFDLGSYPKGESKAVVFDKPGMAEVECAIHPQMFMEIEVK